MYALDATNPLSFYDCLLPELTAYRPRKLKLVHDIQDYRAIHDLKNTELKIVSLFFIFDLTLVLTVSVFY